ncbi:g4321 [Coccomyxa viridis]|uniref:G4321 protein n=1 Tax=Coccomyxa viridis TaxID=1274662 RepID=A0ABP1FU06_9CHLO
MLPEVYYTAGAVFAVFEVLHKGIVKPLLAGSAKKEKRSTPPLPLEQVLQGVQLTNEPDQAGLPETTVLLGLLAGDTDAVVTFIDLLFAVAIKRASKCAAWATQYAQLCSHLRAAGEGSAQQSAVESAVRGRATAEYCRLSTRTVSMTPQGAPKSPDQVNEDAEYLQGSMRFLGSLFREHHLPYAFIRTLVTDLTSHSEKSMPEVHMQPLVALALVGLLHMCADTYVSAELAANGQAAGQHARHLSNVLMRLRASVNPETLPELSADLQDLQFKLTGYASSICPVHPHSAVPRSSADIPRPSERMSSGDLSHVMWPGLRQRGF